MVVGAFAVQGLTIRVEGRDLMYIALAVFASLVGLFVTGAAIFTAWTFYASRKKTVEVQQQDGNAPAAAAGNPWSWFLRWTVADYAALFLFGFGAVFLLTDLVGVAKDRDQFPMYHYAYLLCGIVFSFMGMLFTFVRLALVLRLTGGSAAAHHHPHKPDQTKHAE
jgi:hypothetical protein